MNLMEACNTVYEHLAVIAVLKEMFRMLFVGCWSKKVCMYFFVLG